MSVTTEEVHVCITMGCGCQLVTCHGLDDNDGSADLLSAVADSLTMDEVGDFVTNGGCGHSEDGADRMTVIVTREG